MKVYVETLPDGDADVFPDQVFIVTNKVSEEVTDKEGNTYYLKSYEVVKTMSRADWDKLNENRITRIDNSATLSESAILELSDIVAEVL